MRSRYTAFVVSNAEYLSATWHPRTRPRQILLSADTRWLGLKIVTVTDGDRSNQTGTVEFVAKSKRGGKAHRLHEVSLFERVAGDWYYVSGTHHEKS